MKKTLGHGGSGSFERPPAILPIFRWSMVRPESAGCRRRRWTGCLDMRARPRFMSAMQRFSNARLVYGETINALSLTLGKGIEPESAAWDLQRALLHYLESDWERPDHGIWETRGERKQYTYSKVMAWVAMDRAVKEVERFGLDGPVDRWRRLRHKIHEIVSREGYDAERGAFMQYFGSTKLDASLLMIPIVGFLPPDDVRVRNTVQAIERELMVEDGLLYRYGASDSPGEGIFIACSFWLVENLALMGRHADAERLFERLLRLCNDVGLLSEEYHAERRRLLGNFPQALSHLSLINAAHTLQVTGSRTSS